MIMAYRISIGLMDDECNHCQSLQFKDEHSGIRCEKWQNFIEILWFSVKYQSSNGKCHGFIKNYPILYWILLFSGIYLASIRKLQKFNEKYQCFCNFSCVFYGIRNGFYEKCIYFFVKYQVPNGSYENCKLFYLKYHGFNENSRWFFWKIIVFEKISIF